jgi:polygalacturonase
MPPRWLAALILLLIATFHGFAAAPVNVRDTGATGDGKTLDTAAMQKAIDTVAAAGGGVVQVPAGTYLCGSIELKSHVTLDLDTGATIKASSNADDFPIVTALWEGLPWPCHEALIFADHARDIAITGSGSILGDENVGKLRNPRGPVLIEPVSCGNVRIDGVTLGSVHIWTLHPTYCKDVTVANVTFASTGGNSDGIDPDSVVNMAIDHCTFSAGDDDIAIKSGKGQNGVKIGAPSENIFITNCTFNKGHGGVSFGSELSGGIANVTISNCNFQGVGEALNFKTAAGRAGYIRDVNASHLVVNGVPLVVLRTDYHSNPDAQGVPGDAGLTSFSGILISDVQLTDSKDPVKVIADPAKPLDGFTMNNITGTCKKGFIICNAKNVALSGIKLDGIEGASLFTDNTEGTGLDGAAAYRKDKEIQPSPSP